MASRKAILVIDDEINLRFTLASILQRAGYLVAEAGDAREALLRLAAIHFDLVFLDIRIPGSMDGLGLLPTLRSDYPSTPVVVLSAYATPEVVSEAEKKGAAGCLHKPIDPGQLLDFVHHLLGCRLDEGADSTNATGKLLV